MLCVSVYASSPVEGTTDAAREAKETMGKIVFRHFLPIREVLPDSVRLLFEFP